MKNFTKTNLFKMAIIYLLFFSTNIFAQETALQFNMDTDTTKSEYAITVDGNYTSTFTIEAWVRLDSLISGDQTFIHSYHIQMKKNSDGYVEVYDHGNGLPGGVSTSKLEKGKWMHVAYTQDGGAGISKLYINGTKESKKPNIGGYTYLTVIGNNAGYVGDDYTCIINDDDRWIGAVDEVRFWTSVRDSAEIIDNMNKELTGDESGLIYYYQFNEGSGNIARDLKSGNNFTLNNMEDSDWIDGFFSSQGVPVANAGPDLVVPADSADVVVLDGSASYDLDGTIVNYVWKENGSTIVSGVKPTVALSQGEHVITLTVTDNDGNTDDDDVHIFILSSASNKSIELNKGVLNEFLVGSNFDATQKSWSVECWAKFRTFTDDVVMELHLVEPNEGGLNASTQWYVQTINPDTEESENVLSSNGAGYAFGGTGTIELVVDQWYHLALSVDGVNNKYTWYINGEVDRDSSSLSQNGHPNMMPFVTIGHYRAFEYDADWSAAMAKFDEVRVWYKALSQDEIKANMYKSITTASNLEACWNFDRADYNEDITGHGHTLTSKGPEDSVPRVNVSNLSDDTPPTGGVGINDHLGIVPKSFSLSQNYPNPFNPSTVIDFALPTSQYVKLSVYNMLGEKVSELANSNMSAGNYSVTFDATNFSSGIYFYRISVGDYIEIKKMMLVK